MEWVKLGLKQQIIYQLARELTNNGCRSKQSTSALASAGFITAPSNTNATEEWTVQSLLLEHGQLVQT